MALGIATAQAFSVTTNVTTGQKTDVFGVTLRYQGSTINSLQLRDGAGGTTRWSYAVVKGMLGGGAAATAISQHINFDPAIRFDSGVQCSIQSSTIATIHYRSAV